MSSRAIRDVAKSFRTGDDISSRPQPKPRSRPAGGLQSQPLAATLLAFDLAAAGIPTADWTRQIGIDHSSGRRFEVSVRKHPQGCPYLPKWEQESEEKRRALDDMFVAAKRYVTRIGKTADRKALTFFVDAVDERDASEAGWDPLALDALEFALRNSASASLKLTRTPLGSAKRARHAVSVCSSHGVDVSDWWADVIAVAIMVARLEHSPTWWPATGGRHTQQTIAAFIKQRGASDSGRTRDVAGTGPSTDGSAKGSESVPPGSQAGIGHQQGPIRPKAGRRRHSPTFAEEYGPWLAKLKSKRRPTYANSVDEVFKHHLLPAFANQPVGKIANQEVADFQKRLEARQGRNGLVKDGTVNKIMGHLSRFLIAVSPQGYEGRLHKASSSDKPAPSPPRVIPPDQVTLICSRAPEPYRDYIETGFATGMTTSELNGLRWLDIDFEAKLIRVSQVLVNGVSLPCPESSRRDVPMCDALQRILSQRHANRRPGTPQVFHTPKGTAIDDGNFSRRIWAPLLASCGVPPCPPKAIRSTAAALLLRRGVPPGEVADRLGIKDIGAFKARYGSALRHSPDAVTSPAA